MTSSDYSSRGVGAQHLALDFSGLFNKEATLSPRLRVGKVAHAGQRMREAIEGSSKSTSYQHVVVSCVIIACCIHHLAISAFWFRIGRIRLFSALLDIFPLCLVDALPSRVRMQIAKSLSVKPG
jgi:hypothetical protein